MLFAVISRVLRRLSELLLDILDISSNKEKNFGLCKKSLVKYIDTRIPYVEDVVGVQSYVEPGRVIACLA
jgi:hypothetical protein